MVRPIRSLLFSPVTKPRMVEKALGSEADAVILDLEDAVAAASKDEARRSLPDLSGASLVATVRVNAPDTPWFWPDVAAVVRAGADAIVVPKVEDPAFVTRLDGALSVLEADLGRDEPVEVIPLLESALGVLRVSEILTASTRVSALLYGSAEQGDLVADLGCTWTPDGTGLLTSRAWVLLAARAHAIQQPLDAVFMNIKDLDGLRRECELAKRLGYTGKAAIHPAQLPVINDVFTPTAAEVAQARRIVDIFEETLAAGDGAVAVDGVMVDYASVRQAEVVLARHAAAEQAAARTQS